MAVAWTTIPNGDVDVDSPLTAALITALRDNPEGIAQRATGAPKIFGVPYDFQEFLTNGTWTKPSNAESGDRVILQVVAGGGAGSRGSTGAGGAGGAGIIRRFEDIDIFGASETVVVGAGGAGATGNGAAGGDSSFGTDLLLEFWFTYCRGGGAAATVTGGSIDQTYIISGDHTTDYVTLNNTAGGLYTGGAGGNDLSGGSQGNYGGGGGSGSVAGASGGIKGAVSEWAGAGGDGSDASGALSDMSDVNGKFPGGGGGGIDTGITGDTVGGDGADGVVRVWCIREE